MGLNPTPLSLLLLIILLIPMKETRIYQFKICLFDINSILSQRPLRGSKCGESSLHPPLFCPQAGYPCSSYWRDSSQPSDSIRGSCQPPHSISVLPFIYLPTVCCPWEPTRLGLVLSLLYRSLLKMSHKLKFSAPALSAISLRFLFLHDVLSSY